MNDCWKSFAGDRALERGEAYFADGLVDRLSESNGTVIAHAHGTQDYRVPSWDYFPFADYTDAAPNPSS